tara:strand:+ start:2489 stop:2818 length:330 start_codon:yes stop_codon:yes gene_type:complete
MKFLLVVFFINMGQPMSEFYVFTDPKFETREACVASATNRQEIQKYMMKLMQIYGPALKPIQSVNCLPEKVVLDTIEQMKKEGYITDEPKRPAPKLNYPPTKSKAGIKV